MVTMADRRRHSRNDIDWPVSVYHPRLGMFINGRSVDVSQGGAKVSLPLAVPIRRGQVIELNFPRTTTLAKMAGRFSRIKTALVVRVEDAPVDPPEPFEPSHVHEGGGAATLMAPSRARSKRAARKYVAVQFDKHALSTME